MTREERQLRARQAKDLLDHPLLVESLARIEAAYLDAWRNSPARDPEGRERIWNYLKALERFRADLHSMVADGTIAEAEATAPKEVV